MTKQKIKLRITSRALEYLMLFAAGFWSLSNEQVTESARSRPEAEELHPVHLRLLRMLLLLSRCLYL